MPESPTHWYLPLRQELLHLADGVFAEMKNARRQHGVRLAFEQHFFVGKLAIHPAQVAPIHAAFSPTPEEVAWAERVRAAFHAAPGIGVVAFEGAMLDKPHLRQAERILAAASRG